MEFGGVGVVGKIPTSQISQSSFHIFQKLWCGKYWFLSGFCSWKSKQISTIWVWKEKSHDSLMCSHCWIFKMWKIKKLFTLRPMTQTTLSTLNLNVLNIVTTSNRVNSHSWCYIFSYSIVSHPLASTKIDVQQFWK